MEPRNRLIIVPQYPTKLRYQEWWYTEFPKRFAPYFKEIVVLGRLDNTRESAGRGAFAPVVSSLHFELSQIQEFTDMELHADDTLLLNDLSFPGLFAHILLHKRPRRCFAICHATSKNRYDLFSPVRKIKYPIECKQALLFNTVFVASQYHKNKLGWKNITVIPLPNPPIHAITSVKKEYLIASAARPGIQKVNIRVERAVARILNTTVHRAHTASWEDYYTFLAQHKFLLITAKEETYGYQIIDALLTGTIPLAPRAFSYPEVLPEDFLYTPYVAHEIVDKIHMFTKREQVQLPTIPNHNFFEMVAKHMLRR